MAKILAVDDEESVLALIANALNAQGHLVTGVTDSKAVLDLNLGEYELVILDVMMPDMDGYALCRQIRQTVDCPILFVTAKAMEEEQIYGFSVGADDYITKPFSVGELRARVDAHLRREMRERRSMMHMQDMSFNLSGKELLVCGEKVPLTKSEYEISEFLARHKGQVFSKDKIYESVFGYDGESDSSAITEHVKNIRAKLSRFGFAPLETVWGIGYKWKG